MGIGDFIPDVVEDKVEQGVELVGDGIEEAGDWSADRLEDAGWDGGADWVREQSRSAANTLGADVAELQLGQTEEPEKLVYGSPSSLRSAASHLSDFKTAFENVGNGLKNVKKGSLKGEAADAFEEKVGLEPKKWFAAADACEKAAGALKDFAGTVEWAQGRAREALTKWEADEKDEAEEILRGARSQRNEAAARATSAVQAARGSAPPKPSYAEQLQDGAVGMQLDSVHALSGIGKGTAGLVNFVRSVNVLDPYNLTHPAEYLTNLNSTATGLLRVANDPVGAGKQMWENFKKDPAEGTGRLLPELLGTKGLGMVKGAARAAKLADNAPTGRGKVDSDGPDQSNRSGKETDSGGSDPVDLATGKMYLPQTDIALPGAMPLVFTRRVESGYRLGRWFGPSWSSTIDQRLEIDAEGVIFIAEDGRLLSYAHPAPGLPTLPSTGSARMPLERTPDGGYTLTDPDTGWVRHFAPPGVGAEVDGDARIEQITDRSGHHIAFDYDAHTGAPLRIVHSSGYELRLTVDGDRVTALSLVGAGPDGTDQTVVTYGYAAGHLTDVTSGGRLRFEYDDEARVMAWIDSNDRRYDYVYDNLDRCIAEGGTEGHMQVRIDYDGFDQATGHKVTTLTTAAGNATKHLFNDRYQSVGLIDPLGNRTRSERDAHNRPLSHTDALGHTTCFDYDENGRVAAVRRPDGATVSITRNDLGLPTSTTGPDGAVWRQEWDGSGNRTATVDPAGNTTRYTYDGRGHLASVTDALGATTTVVCDAIGLPVEITNPLGAVTRYQRDAYGRPVLLTDPLGAVTRLEWTVEGRLARRIDPEGAEQTWTYDGEGNCVRHIDAAGGATTYEYTHFDLLAAQTGPDGVRYAFSHDAELRLTQVTNPQGLTWAYTYDPAGRLISETDFDDRTLTYTHDAAGRLTARTNPLGQTVSFTRDDLGQILSKDADGRATTYAYDPAGRLLEAVSPDTELRYQRDKLGRIKSEMVGGRVLTHTYDALGRRIRRTTPTGAVSTFTYDAAGNRTALTTGGHTLDFAHDAAGRETARRIGASGLTLAQVWDPSGRLTTQSLTTQPLTAPGTEAAADVVQQRSYTYRADGYLTGIDDHLAGSSTFDLDAAGRVTAVHARGWSETYAYDEAGNQAHAAWPTTHAAPEATGCRTYTGTRITTAGRIRYEHDAGGRLTLRQKTRLSKKPDSWRYTWDAEDRLTHVITPDGTTWRYRYDPMGRRTAKQRLTDEGDIAEQVDFTWDGPTLVEQTTTAAQLPHPVTLTWDHDGFTPLAQTERLTDEATQTEIDSRFFAIVTDLVGTPSELVDEAGDIAWRTRTTLWGTTTWETDSRAYTPLRFPGQYFDPETGLHYNVHRYYDPTTARYTTPDPLGLTPAPNPSTYVTNPQSWCDPVGLTPYRPLREGHNSQPAFEKDPYHPDVVERRIEASREAYGVKNDPAGMIGSNGTQVTSKTMWNQGPYRIDVENPNPGQRPGQMHFQDQSNPTEKYQYNFESGKFEGLPRGVEKSVGSDPRFIAGIRKGLNMLGEG